MAWVQFLDFASYNVCGLSLLVLYSAPRGFSPVLSSLGLQGWRSGERTCLPPMWPGFDSQTRRHMWVEFVDSLLCTERFSPGTPVFSSPQKPFFDLICSDFS